MSIVYIGPCCINGIKNIGALATIIDNITMTQSIKDKLV